MYQTAITALYAQSIVHDLRQEAALIRAFRAETHELPPRIPKASRIRSSEFSGGSDGPERDRTGGEPRRALTRS